MESRRCWPAFSQLSLSFVIFTSVILVGSFLSVAYLAFLGDMFWRRQAFGWIGWLFRASYCSLICIGISLQCSKIAS